MQVLTDVENGEILTQVNRINLIALKWKNQTYVLMLSTKRT